MQAAIGGTEDSTVLLRSSGAAKHAGKNDVRICWMHDDVADSSRLRQSHVGPGLAGVGGLINSVAHHVAIADYPRFASSGPHDSRVRRRDRQRTDRCGRLLVKY